MGQVKPGFGPREPDGRGWNASEAERLPDGEDRYKRTGSKPRGGTPPVREQTGTPRLANRGLSVDKGRAQAAANEALAASKRVRDAKARGVDDHDATSHFNETMAALHQVHPGLHQSVQAIHHLETTIADAKAHGGKPNKAHEAYLKEAHANLKARLNKGNNFTYNPAKKRK